MKTYRFTRSLAAAAVALVALAAAGAAQAGRSDDVYCPLACRRPVCNWG